MATATKLKDSKWMKITVENRNPEVENQSAFVGGVVIEKGEAKIRHYRFQMGKVIEIPEDFVEQLKNRSQVAKDKKTGERINVPLYLVEKA